MAGRAHTDFDCLTLLIQRLARAACRFVPVKTAKASSGPALSAREEVITCNIGDMLMRWSDDQLPSNFHRVRNPLPTNIRFALQPGVFLPGQ